MKRSGTKDTTEESEEESDPQNEEESTEMPSNDMIVQAGIAILLKNMAAAQELAQFLVPVSEIKSRQDLFEIITGILKFVLRVFKNASKGIYEALNEDEEEGDVDDSAKKMKELLYFMGRICVVFGMLLETTPATEDLNDQEINIAIEMETTYIKLLRRAMIMYCFLHNTLGEEDIEDEFGSWTPASNAFLAPSKRARK